MKFQLQQELTNLSSDSDPLDIKGMMAKLASALQDAYLAGLAEGLRHTDENNAQSRKT